MLLEFNFIVRVLYSGLAIYLVFLIAALLLQERRFSIKKTAVLWGLAGIVIILDLYFCFGLLPEELKLPVSMIIGIVYLSATFIYVSADGFWKKCYLLEMYYCICCISWTIGLYLYYLIWPDSPIAVENFVRCIMHFVITLPPILAYRKYGRSIIRRVSGFHHKSWMALSAFSMMYLCIFVVLMSKIKADRHIDMEPLGFFIASICTFAVGNVLSFTNIFHMRKESRVDLMKQQVDYLTMQMESSRSAEEQVHRLYHDKRHHDEFIAALAKAGDTDGILRYLQQERQETEQHSVLYCPNRTVNSILVSYAAKAESSGVLFSAEADTGREVAVADVDFVAILANLLENALHGCIEIGGSGPIRARLRMVGRRVVIAVSNPCASGFRIENGLPVARGIGIDSIISTAKRYHGEVNYTIKDGICTACVTLNI